MEQTPFKAVFTKKTNFLTQSFNTESQNINFGTNKSFLIPRHGDFLTRVYLLLDYESTKSTSVNQAHAMIDYVSLIIGGTTVQQESGETLNLRLNVSEVEDKTFSIVQLYRMLGGGPDFPFTDTLQYPRTYRMQIPLDFWFHGNINLAIPLFALRYQEVEVEVGIRESSRWGGVDSGINNIRASLQVEYGYVPDEIMIALSKKPFILPIEQFQYYSKKYTNDSVIEIKPTFINPIKSLFLLFKNKETETTAPFDYSREIKIQKNVNENDFLNWLEVDLDGQILMPKEVGTFEMLRGFQYYAHFPGATQNILGPYERYCGFIYALALCKDPMNRVMPNGGINFSLVKNQKFKISTKGKNTDEINLKLYALSINFLYIENGIAKMTFPYKNNLPPRFI